MRVVRAAAASETCVVHDDWTLVRTHFVPELALVAALHRVSAKGAVWTRDLAREVARTPMTVRTL